MSDLLALFNSYEQILNRGFSVKDIRVPYRNINHWDEKDLLLDTKRVEGQWRKFNFMDCMWIRVISELRKFGVSFALIKQLKDILAEKVPFQVSEELEQDLDYYNILMLLLIEIIITRSPISILLHTDGNSFFYNPAQKDEYDGAYQLFIKKPYISISLSYLLAEFMIENDIALFEKELPLVSSNEYEVLIKIQNFSIRELILYYDDQSSKVIVSDGAKYESREAKLDFILEIFSCQYEQVTYQTTDGKTVAFKTAVADRQGDPLQ